MSGNLNTTNDKPQQEETRLSSRKSHAGRWTAVGIFIGLALAAFVVINPLHWELFAAVQRALLRQEVLAPAAPGQPQPEKGETGLWTCGMHPQVIQDTPGNCPICGMKLVPLKRTTLSESAPQPSSPKLTPSAGKKIKYWVAPMDPTYISDKPGKSPMGMDLVPVYEGEEKTAGTVITIDPVTVQNIGVKSQQLVRGELAHTIRTIGTLDYNDKAIYWVTMKYDGWIQKVYVNYVGEHVAKGQKLFEIYSPDLVSTQEEYITALDYAAELQKAPEKFQTRAHDTLLDAVRKRLEYWDITDEQIKTLEQTRQIKKSLTVVSPVDGYVVQKMDEALEGMYVKPGMNLYKIADLSTIWIHADVYEYELPWIQVGQEVEIEIPYLPDERFTGKVLYEYPYLSEKTRTMKICVEADNPGRRMRPGMYANVRIIAPPVEDVLQVPEEAVIHSGERNVVIVDKGGGRFEPRTVTLGVQGDGVFEVKSGLHDGERAVTSAQFLIDSESNLREAINKMIESRLAAKQPSTSKTPTSSETSAPVETPSMSGHAHPAAREESTSIPLSPALDEALSHVLEDDYIPIWEALAADSTEGVIAHAEAIASQLQHLLLTETNESVSSLLAPVIQSSGRMTQPVLADLRTEFQTLSQTIITLMEHLRPTALARRSYAVFYCPMTKAFWIQDAPEVRNPYFGSQMLECGEKQRDLSPKGVSE